MRRYLLPLTALILNGCYTTAAVLDLAKQHSPSVVKVERSANGETLTTRTEYGTLPSDVTMTEWMPDRHLRTRRVITSRLSSDAASCQPIVTTLVGLKDVVVNEEPQLIYASGPFPVSLSDQPYRSLDRSTCWLVGKFAVTDRWYPPPTSLVLVGDSDELLSIPLPVEWGVESWRRWLWLPAAPVIDVAALVIVPTEWVTAGVENWTTPSTRGSPN